MVRKKAGILYLVLVLLSIQMLCTACASNASETGKAGSSSVSADISSAVPVIDREDDSSMPHQFRTSASDFQKISKKNKAQMDRSYIPSREGLDTLHMSGSAQPSEGEYKQLASVLKQYDEGPIYVVDLRQESHGFLNGDAVSWYAEHNWANQGKTEEEIRKDENNRVETSLHQTMTWYQVDKKEHVQAGEKETVNQAMTEEQLAESEGLRYFRITATDHIWPSPEDIDRFIEFYKELPKGAWLHFHCKMGVGRTTEFMAMYDMMRNPSVSLKDILYRQCLIGGNYVAYVSDSGDDWKSPYYAEKKKMVGLFYQYVQENHGSGFAIPWSAWLKQQSE